MLLIYAGILTVPLQDPVHELGSCIVGVYIVIKNVRCRNIADSEHNSVTIDGFSQLVGTRFELDFFPTKIPRLSGEQSGTIKRWCLFPCLLILVIVERT